MRLEYRALYATAAWRHPRHGLRVKAFVRDLNVCQRCRTVCIGKDPEPNSPVAHHQTPHKGDPALFYDLANIETLCKSCHDGPVAESEARGYSTEIGVDGFPVDPRHPFNRAGTGRGR